jgi:hypothetical protein
MEKKAILRRLRYVKDEKERKILLRKLIALIEDRPVV